jgi:hypothetical protein
MGWDGILAGDDSEHNPCNSGHAASDQPPKIN